MGFENNYFKATNNIFNLKLKPNQFAILTYLIKCANNKDFCYPSLNNIYEMCCVSKQTVVRTLKELVTLGYIRIEKDKHNIYYINYNVIENTNSREKTTTCDEALNSKDNNVVKEYLEKNQITMDEVIESNVEVVANETGLKTKNVEELLEINNNIAKVIEAINYAKEHKPKNLMAYTKHILKNGFSDKVNNINNVMPNSNFANFTQRKYDYDKLELQLLGWADFDDDDE